ncbi:MAG: MBL fold metallo-hydrolase [Sphaerochaetaceae bacterium]|jgi:metallo-beta-lactamase class B|nr:MBL fold metallo-hydrolase [Sphaerochaetaceae bacterium]
MSPFRVIGNLYFVGTRPASSHIIDTGDGLIMLDSGYPEDLKHIINSIQVIGFSCQDIKIILHSHGHIDHIGNTRSIVQLSGAKTIIGRLDADYVTGKRDLSFAKELGMEFSQFFTPDVLLEDGATVSLGNTVIRCIHTPGHTEGTMSYFFDVMDNGRDLRVGTHGGVGTNSMEKSFLQRYALPLSLRDDFRAGLDRLKREHVDVFIGNHQDQCNTVDKYKQIMAGNKDAFIDSTAWPEFLLQCENRLDRMLAEEDEWERETDR